MKLKIFIIVSTIILAMWVLREKPDGKTHLVFCDVGQGDGALAFKGYNQFIIDTGPENGNMLRCLERHLPFWDRKIESVIVSHWDQDHSGGLDDLLKYYKIDKLFSGEKMENNKEQISYSAIVGKNDVISMDMINFEILSPRQITGESNTDSLVGVLNIMGDYILMLGDAAKEIEQQLVWRKELPTSIRIVKVGHHGSDSSSSDELIMATKPKTAIISVGKNSFGHPAPQVINKWLSVGTEVWRTDEKGDYHIWW